MYTGKTELAKVKELVTHPSSAGGKAVSDVEVPVVVKGLTGALVQAGAPELAEMFRAPDLLSHARDFYRWQEERRLPPAEVERDLQKVRRASSAIDKAVQRVTDRDTLASVLVVTSRFGALEAGSYDSAARLLLRFVRDARTAAQQGLERIARSGGTSTVFRAKLRMHGESRVARQLSEGQRSFEEGQRAAAHRRAVDRFLGK